MTDQWTDDRITELAPDDLPEFVLMDTPTELMGDGRSEAAHTRVDDAPADPQNPSRGRRLLRGRPEDPAWVRPSLLGLLALTALLYLWDLGASGWANSFYSAAVQAGSVSWKAMFFGSSDAANLITVDKPPASLWVMEVSARIFGVNSWSILAPQALEGVAAVGLLYAAVRRWFGAPAGLLAGAVLALTPVAALMFKFNNPDALLVLLLVAGAWALTRSLEKASMKWLMFAAGLVGTAFLAKSLQAFLVVPAFALAYLVCAPTTVRKRVLHLLAAGGALLVAAGWWVAIVELWPASSRPYIGGSQHNSVLELIFGYNGFGRLTGDETGSVTGGGATGGTSMWGATGITRLFSSSFGGQISWLLPTALIMLGVMAWISLRAVRTDRVRAAAIIWGGWLLVTGVVISFGQGIIHPYYTVALAPAIGALIGIGSVLVWAKRDAIAWRVVAAVTVAVTAGWAYVLLERSPDWQPWLRYVVAIGGLVVAVGLLMVNQLARKLALALAAGALVVGLAGPAAYALETATTGHTGSIPSAGPAVAGGFGGPGGAGGGPGGACWRLRWPARRDRDAAGWRLRWTWRSWPGRDWWSAHRHRHRDWYWHWDRHWDCDGHGDGHGHGGRHGPGRRSWLRWWSRWLARIFHAERRTDGSARGGRELVHLGRCRGGSKLRCWLPARYRPAGDVAGRLQRQRPVPDAGRVRGRRRGAQGALLHRERRHRWSAERWEQRHRSHHQLGGVAFHGADDRWDDGVRPVGHAVVDQHRLTDQRDGLDPGARRQADPGARGGRPGPLVVWGAAGRRVVGSPGANVPWRPWVRAARGS